jgi:hypothetical protein
VFDAIQATFFALQGVHGLSWREAAHCLVGYGLDAMHMNSGPDGVEGELREVRDQVDKMLAELPGLLSGVTH